MDDVQCTAEILAAQMGPLVHWNRCKNFVDWDGDEDPLCEEHDEEAAQMEKADLARKMEVEA
jgi:hypothetical protein